MGSLVSGYCSLLLLLLFLVPTARSGDAEALLALKSAVDPLDSLPWREGNAGAVCSWAGVRNCMDGRVTKLVLESLNLTGSLDGKTLNRLDQLRVLSLKDNSISGDVPDLSGLVNLKSLYLNGNALSGGFPSSLTGLHRLKILVLAGNRISGEIPVSVLNLRRLYVFYLQDNGFTGGIPPLNQWYVLSNLSYPTDWYLRKTIASSRTGALEEDDRLLRTITINKVCGGLGARRTNSSCLFWVGLFRTGSGRSKTSFSLVCTVTQTS